MRVGENARHRIVLDDQPPRGDPLDDGDRRRLARELRQNAHDFTAAAIAARMNNAATRMRRFEAKQKFAFPVAIEGRAEADQVLDRSRRRGENPLATASSQSPSPASSVSARCNETSSSKPMLRRPRPGQARSKPHGQAAPC